MKKQENQYKKCDFRNNLNSLCFVMGSYGRIKSFTADTSIGFEPSQGTNSVQHGFGYKIWVPKNIS